MVHVFPIRFPLLAIVLMLLLAGSLPVRAFEDSMAERTLACTVCHGEQGRAGPQGYYPRLAGKPALYLYNQLVNLREGRRHYALMTGLLDRLDAPAMRAMAEHFSGLDLPYAPPLPPQAPAAVLARGKRLAEEGDTARGIPACSQCHGTALTGVLPSTPGLLGLPRDYVNAQLGGWKTGQRRAQSPDCMARIAQKLDASDISAVSGFLAAQAVPAHAHAASSKPPLAPGAVALECGSATVWPGKQGATIAAQVERGAYLARIGNCALCHTARAGAAYAGGRALDTPFGAVVSSNITPDPGFGIGQWSADDFWNALHHGKSRDGRWLYPAFPYTSYTAVTREDADALFAFLRTVPASSQQPPSHTLRWPYSTQAALGVWRALFFTAGTPAVSTPARAGDSTLQRGAYLVQGLGHCFECHAPRNALGAIAGDALASPNGSTLGASRWVAPSLLDPAQASVAHWSVDEITALLVGGVGGRGAVSGPMAEVVLHGTQYLSPADAAAMARYLQSLPRVTAPAASAVALSAPAMPAPGRAVYEKHCADCHGLSGQGQPGAYPALAGNRAVTMASTNNQILAVLYGGFAPATASHPRPFGMPPFMLQLSDTEIAQALTYVRNAWGNAAPAVGAFDVYRLRASLSP